MTRAAATRSNGPSIRRAGQHQRYGSRNYRRPREIARQQAAENCAVSFEFRDTVEQHMQLFKVSAWDQMYPGTVIAAGWGFSRSGFRNHDTVSVVLPKVWCGDIVISGFSATLLQPDSLRLNVAP